MLDAVPVPGLQLHGIPAPLAPSKAAQWHMRAWSLSGVEVLFKPALLMLALWVGRCFHLCISLRTSYCSWLLRGMTCLYKQAGK